VRSSAIFFVSVVMRTRSSFATRCRMLSSTSSTCPFVGLTMTWKTPTNCWPRSNRSSRRHSWPMRWKNSCVRPCCWRIYPGRAGLRCARERRQRDAHPVGRRNCNRPDHRSFAKYPAGTGTIGGRTEPGCQPKSRSVIGPQIRPWQAPMPQRVCSLASRHSR
jgi:hypothetical protein